MKFQNCLVYSAAAVKACLLHPRPSTWAFALRYARQCVELYERPRQDPLSDPRPWLCFPAIDELERHLTPEARVFEYGSGASTIYLAQRVQEVVSVEHDRAWHERVRAELQRRHVNNVQYELIEPAPEQMPVSSFADPLAYRSSDAAFSRMNFKSYARAIDRFPDGHFDLVVVDGRARPSCLLHARAKVRAGGTLLLDQSERGYYLSQAGKLFPKREWTRRRLMAPLPFSLHFTEAIFFTKADR